MFFSVGCWEASPEFVPSFQGIEFPVPPVVSLFRLMWQVTQFPWMSPAAEVYFRKGRLLVSWGS
jgi:hypothetical protein